MGNIYKYKKKPLNKEKLELLSQNLKGLADFTGTTSKVRVPTKR